MKLRKSIIKTMRYGGVKAVAERINRRVGMVSPIGSASGKICLRPFYYASIHTDGRIYCCCPSWVKFCLGKLSEKTTIADIWNNRIAQTFRSAMLKTELDRVCKDQVCPDILSECLPRFEGRKIQFDKNSKGLLPIEIGEDQDVISAIEKNERRLNFLPKYLEFAADSRCNLSCPSCRSNLINKVSEKEQKTFNLCIRVLEDIGPGLKRLFMLGNGEVFFSRFCLNLLKSLNRSKYPDLSVDIITNGQLLDEKMWERIGTGAQFIEKISISIDAAKKETYEDLRRGAKWKKLLDNMAFVKSLRQSGKVTNFSINFVISDRNFSEMGDFVRLGEGYAVDKVVFTQIQAWNSMNMDYKKAAVHHPSNKLHREFLSIINDPIFKSERVLLGI